MSIDIQDFKEKLQMEKRGASFDKYRNDDEEDTRYTSKKGKYEFNKKDRKDKKKFKGQLWMVEKATETFVRRIQDGGKDYIQEFYDKLRDKEFINEIMSLYEDNSQMEEYYDTFCVIGRMIKDAVDSKRFEKEKSHELLDLASILLEPRAVEIGKFIKKKKRPSPNVLIRMALLVPSPEVVNPSGNLFYLVRELNDIMYRAADTDEDWSMDKDSIVTLYQNLFGEENLPDCAVACLLEKPEVYHSLKTERSKKLWNKISSIALDILEEIQDFGILKNYMKNYMYYSRGKSQRIDFDDMKDEGYDNVYKAYKNLKHKMENRD